MRGRQVHLDFHTSPLIRDLAVEFDPAAFAATFQRARVDSVTVFAKCHHGMCYYPTRTGTPHPALGKRDLLGQMIEALHREGIRAPIYTTVGWEEDVAERFPAWRQVRADGTFARAGNPFSPGAPYPGGWRFIDWANPDYQDYLEAQIREICRNYPVDGLFFDILFYAPGAHHSAAARAFGARRGISLDDGEGFRRFESSAQAVFATRFTRLVRGLAPKATVFYNASFDLSTAPGFGARARQRQVTHQELESLPSGFWGYYHFPRLARAVQHWGMPWLGMTGRFQRMWGDFGGLKPQAALEYECFRTQALGGGNSVGDQLPPRGRLDPGAYALIGAVYRECEAAEPFYRGSVPLREVGVLTASHPARDPERSARSDEGAVLMCEETHYEAAVLDAPSSFQGYSLLVLPDETVISGALAARLRRFHARGGTLILSHRAGRDAAGRWMLDFLPLRFAGEEPLHPTYWRVRRAFAPDLAGSDRVVYSQGLRIARGRGISVLADRVLPYFQRTDAAFCSHFQAPPQARADRHPAVVSGRGFVYFADPIFREYRTHGNLLVREVWRRAVDAAIGPPRWGAGLPTTVLSCARRRGSDLIVSLLHYVPVRKAIANDVLEERMSFAGLELKLDRRVRAVRGYGASSGLAESANGGWALPSAAGRLLLEAPGYFVRRQ